MILLVMLLLPLAAAVGSWFGGRRVGPQLTIASALIDLVLASRVALDTTHGEAPVGIHDYLAVDALSALIV
ncbi:MAG: hypothetical protein ACREDY_27225, partial [Bradyrhizobium sp.]